VAAGCGGDSTSNSPQDAGGGIDATIDVLEDAVAAQDSAPFSDGAVGPDADADADAATKPDADADAEAGAADSSSGLNAQTFPSVLATAFCNTIAACCGTAGDAATFNWQSCYNIEFANGFKGINTNGANLVDGGNVTFNVAQAQRCLDLFAAADCTSNQLTSTEETQLFQSCYAAYVGTLATGSPCAGTIECAPGNFCMPVDGGVGDAGAIGLCQALAGVGQACGGQTVCSYRGSASNGLFCQNTCQPQFTNGTNCSVNQDCVSLLCVQVGTTNSFKCGAAGDWAYPNTCASYVVPVDAGGGG
jgi:hypothetical protein